MAAASVITGMNDDGYKRWLKVDEGILVMKDALMPTITAVIQKLHADVVAKLPAINTGVAHTDAINLCILMKDCKDFGEIGLSTELWDVLSYLKNPNANESLDEPEMMNDFGILIDLLKVPGLAALPECVQGVKKLEQIRDSALDGQTEERAGESSGVMEKLKTLEADSKCENTGLSGQCGKRLGKGGFGTVFAHSEESSKAIKKISLATGSNLDSVQKEIDILIELKGHPRIVQYFRHENDTHNLYILMERVQQGSLREHLKQADAFDEKRSHKYTSQVLDGLEYLHTQKIVHGDIKAQNILLDANDDIKLCDFGLAKTLVEATKIITTEVKGRVGTPFWMAPEVAADQGYSQKSDIWSLGCTLVEMLTTEPPCAIIPLKDGELPDYKLPPETSEAAKAFLSRCFTVNPHDRPTATDLKQSAFIQERHRQSLDTSAECRRWIQLLKGLYLVKDALCPYVDQALCKFHTNLTQSLGPYCCSASTLSLKLDRHTNKWNITGAPACVGAKRCPDWLNAIAGIHLEAVGKDVFKSCNMTQLNTSFWEVAKTFLSAVQARGTKAAADLDPYLLMKMTIQCSLFCTPNHVQDAVNQVLDTRNLLVHSGLQGIQTDAVLKEKLNEMIELVRLLPQNDFTKETIHDLEKGSLLDHLNKTGAFDEKRSHKYTSQVLDGLEYLHKHEPKIVHRDVKGWDSRMRLDKIPEETFEEIVNIITMTANPRMRLREIAIQCQYGGKFDAEDVAGTLRKIVDFVATEGKPIKLFLNIFEEYDVSGSLLPSYLATKKTGVKDEPIGSLGKQQIDKLVNALGDICTEQHVCRSVAELLQYPVEELQPETTVKILLFWSRNNGLTIARVDDLFKNLQLQPDVFTLLASMDRKNHKFRA